jgi:hypothetical protein
LSSVEIGALFIDHCPVSPCADDVCPSLLAMKLAGELRQKFPSSSVRVVELYSRATIQRQVELIEGSRAIPQSSIAEVSSVRSEPEPAFAIPASGSNGTLNAVKSKLTEIWQDLLGVTEISTEINFFDAGGHRLDTRLAHCLSQF